MQHTFNGMVATSPRSYQFQEGTYELVSFRFAVTENDIVSWYTVITKGLLAKNIYESLTKTDRIIVTGQLRMVDWDNGERSGTTAEIDADSIGHDLSYGQSKFTRNNTKESN